MVVLKNQFKGPNRTALILFRATTGCCGSISHSAKTIIPNISISHLFRFLFQDIIEAVDFVHIEREIRIFYRWIERMESECSLLGVLSHHLLEEYSRLGCDYPERMFAESNRLLPVLPIELPDENPVPLFEA